MIRKILCFIGWHEFAWKLRVGEGLNTPPPDNAKCKHCGVIYKSKPPENKETDNG